MVQVDSDFVDPSYQPVPEQGIYKQARYFSLNLIWSPIPPFDVGFEYLYGHKQVTEASAEFNGTSDYGLNNRIQFTLSWKFAGETKLGAR